MVTHVSPPAPPEGSRPQGPGDCSFRGDIHFYCSGVGCASGEKEAGRLALSLAIQQPSHTWPWTCAPGILRSSGHDDVMMSQEVHTPGLCLQQRGTPSVSSLPDKVRVSRAHPGSDVLEL